MRTYNYYDSYEGREAVFEVEGLFHRVITPEAELKNFYRKDKKQFVITASDAEVRNAKCVTAHDNMMNIIYILRALGERYTTHSWYLQIRAVEQSAEELHNRGYSNIFVDAVKEIILLALMTIPNNAELFVYELIDTAQELYDVACYRPLCSIKNECRSIVDIK